jgi:GR25 family glycosyltransferase involved in LPS biosynthesis
VKRVVCSCPQRDGLAKVPKGFTRIVTSGRFLSSLHACAYSWIATLDAIGDDEGIKIEDDIYPFPDFEERIEKCRGLSNRPYFVSGFNGMHRKWIHNQDWNTPTRSYLYTSLWGGQCEYYSPGVARMFATALREYMKAKLFQHCDTFLHLHVAPRIPVLLYLYSMCDHKWDVPALAASCTHGLFVNPPTEYAMQ